MSEITYVIQIDSPEALVKFGRTKSPKSRMQQLSTGMPWNVRVVALIGADCERDLKAKFAAECVKGEWFRPTPALQEWLDEAADAGRLVKQIPVDGSYLNAVIKPRIREYLSGRDPTNTSPGDLVCRIFADMLPTLVGREKELVAATKGHVTEAMCRGFAPTIDRVHVIIPVVSGQQAAAA
jgi:hypothetical protein